MAPKNYLKSSNESAKRSASVELEFPDMGGMDFYTPRLSAGAALRRNDEYILGRVPDPASRQRDQKCEVEFTL